MKIFLSSGYEKLINKNHFLYLSNETFFKKINFQKNNFNYEFISSLPQNYQTRFRGETLTNKIIKEIEYDLYNCLNIFHSVNFSHRYWKIIIGHWLSRFVKSVYFRYELLNHCLKKNKNFDYVYTSTFDSYTQSIPNTSDYWLASIDEEWNFNLFSKILNYSFSDKFNSLLVKTENLNFISKNENIIYTKKEIFKKKFHNFLSLFNIFSLRNSVAFKTTYLSFYDELKLSLFNNELPSILVNLSYNTKEIDNISRKKISLQKDNYNNFENLIRHLIPDALPKTVIEDYSNILKATQKCYWPKKPKVIFTSNSYDGDDFFKVWTAQKIEKFNSKYIIGQHGLLDSSEVLLKNLNDYQTCDYYIRWGEKKYEKDLKLFNIKIINRKIKLNSNNSKILIFSRSCGHEVEAYSRLDEFKVYNSCLYNLLKSFPKNYKKDLILRLKRTVEWLNFSEFLNLKQSFPNIQIDDGKLNIYSILKNTKLSIFLYYSTGVLEAISFNVPVVFFHPKHLNYMDPIEKKYFDILNKCKILSFNEIEFQNNINSILKDVTGWWKSDLVEEAKQIFSNRYNILETHKPIKKISKLLSSFI